LKFRKGIAEHACGIKYSEIHKPDNGTNRSSIIGGVGESETAFTTIKLLLLSCHYLAFDSSVYVLKTFPQFPLLQER
jgi:hypothetical protein